ncbi:MAG: 5-formyltetrahydrofolate cyclo-ligase [Clostridia bacterium]|nr:5-formyltetrahydrofolate cyclo-ligase [Clostridia bacterium]
MAEIRIQKTELRAKYREHRRALDKKLRVKMDDKICKTIISLASFRYADTLLIYSPTEDEINVNPVAKEALRRGKTVAFPVSHGKGIMTFHTVTSLDELRNGKNGIKEPPADNPVCDPRSVNALCIVPAFIFDTDGYRVGYGGGYYDRYLADFDGNKLGVVYSEFIVPRLPRGRFDIAVNLLVCEKEVIVTGEN